MSDAGKRRREDDDMPSESEIDRAVMAHVLAAAVEQASADAAYLVWTSKRGRKTRIHRLHVGNLVTVHGLMRWVRDRIDAIEDVEKDEAEDD